jgi:hypothetical protein
MEAMRDFQQNHVNDLKTGLSGLLTQAHPESMKILADAESKLISMSGELQKQHDTNALIERDLRRQNLIRASLLSGTYVPVPEVRNGDMRHLGSVEVQVRGRPGSLQQTESAMRGGNLNAVTAARIELQRLTRVQQAEKSYGTPESQMAAKIAVREQAIEVAKARNNMALFGANFAESITGDAAGGRTFRNGRARPLSETERLAQRAAMFRDRARNLILEGSTGGGAGRSIAAARLDEAHVASRLSAASASIAAPPGVTDATALKAELINTNKILTAIQTSLTPTGVQ